MKHFKLLTLLFFFSFTLLNAQKVALHSAGNVRFFTGINALVSAYSASVSGDTIYLPGGSFNAVSSIDKPVVIFGTGHYPDSTQVTGKTYFNGNVVLKNNADNCYFEGIEFTGTVSFAYNESVNGVIFKQCKFNNLVSVEGDLANPSQNISFIGNVFLRYLSLPNGMNALIANNIIKEGVDASYGNLIQNNILLSRLPNGSYENFRGSNNLLSNNVFLLHGSYGMTNGSGNRYYNNLLAFSNPAYGTNATTENNYTGITASAVFVNQSDNLFSYESDYHLATSSVYIGTDGTQVGIYGGVFPYKNGAVPSNPHISSAQLAPQTNNQGQLNVRIHVKAQNN